MNLVVTAEDDADDDCGLDDVVCDEELVGEDDDLDHRDEDLCTYEIFESPMSSI